MIEQNYSVEEILLAVDEIRNKKKEKSDKSPDKRDIKKKYYSDVPKNTLKLIEEAEKSK
tara:strand:+ start:174 stop:350 length:177 start_codon:yes stop_codon:yes gene_type:complete